MLHLQMLRAKTVFQGGIKIMFSFAGPQVLQKLLYILILTEKQCPFSKTTLYQCQQWIKGRLLVLLHYRKVGISGWSIVNIILRM